MTDEQIRYAKYLANLYAKRFGWKDGEVAFTREEFRSEIMARSVEAMRAYDGERSEDWKAYLSFKMYWACIDYLRRVTKTRKVYEWMPAKRLSERDRYDSDEDHLFPNVRRRDDAVTQPQQHDIRIDIQRALDALQPGRSKEIFLRWLDGETMTDIAKDYNITPARVSQLIKEVRVSLTARLGSHRFS